MSFSMGSVCSASPVCEFDPHFIAFKSNAVLCGAVAIGGDGTGLVIGLCRHHAERLAVEFANLFDEELVVKRLSWFPDMVQQAAKAVSDN